MENTEFQRKQSSERDTNMKCAFCGRDMDYDVGLHDCPKNPGGMCIPEELL